MGFWSFRIRTINARRAAALAGWAVLLAPAAPGWGAISVDSTPVSQAGTTAFNTFSFTTGPGADRILIVAAVVTSDDRPDAVESATFNGVALSRELTTGYFNGVGQTLDLWYLGAPAAATTANVAVRFWSANNNVVGALEYAGVDPATPFGAVNASTDDASPLSTTLTTQYSGSRLLFSGGTYDCPDTYSLDPNFTQRWGMQSGGTVGVFLDRGAGAPGSYSGTNAYTDSPTDTVVQQLLELVPLQSTPTPTAGATSTATPGPSGPGFVSPNPFFPDRPPLDWARFALPSGHAAVHLSLLDLDLRVRWQGDFSPGSNVEWNGRDQEGALLHSGVYLYLLEEDGQATRKGSLVLAR